MTSVVLMTNFRYRTTDNVNLPFKVHAVVNEITKNRVEYKVIIRALYSSHLSGQNVVIKIPTPLNTANTRINITGGKAKYVGSDNCMVWK